MPADTEDEDLSPADEARIEQRKREILDATIRCIRQFSVKKVAVEDIAQAAGISRRTLYRFFSGRRAIMAALVFDRLTTIAAGVKAALRQCNTFEDAIVVGTIETIRLARADRIFEALVEDDRSLTLDPDPHNINSPIRSLSASIWADVFANARASGLLRTSITNQEAMDWLIEVHRLLDVRADLTDEEIESVLRHFVLPSFVPDSMATRAREAPAKRRAPK